MNNDHIKLQCLATCYRENYQDKSSSTATTFFYKHGKILADSYFLYSLVILHCLIFIYPCQPKISLLIQCFLYCQMIFSLSILLLAASFFFTVLVNTYSNPLYGNLDIHQLPKLENLRIMGKYESCFQARVINFQGIWSLYFNFFFLSLWHERPLKDKINRTDVESI